MTAIILSGSELAKSRREELKKRVQILKAHQQIQPSLAVVLIGDDPASQIYVSKKKQACDDVGIESFSYILPASTSETELLMLIEQLNQSNNIDGILVQLPLPAQIDQQRIIQAISPAKDVDGFHPYNVGMLALRQPAIRPCTPHGVMNLLEHYQLSVRGLDACVIGSSNIVGRPMMLELLHAGATVSICHRFTKDISHYVQHADLLISATGHPGLIHSEWIKPGAIVIDVGITRQPDGSICGDIDFESAKERAGYLTPVPGGVGPMTVMTLLENTVLAATQRRCK